MSLAGLPGRKMRGAHRLRNTFRMQKKLRHSYAVTRMPEAFFDGCKDLT